jgi:hypothetical protein
MCEATHTAKYRIPGMLAAFQSTMNSHPTLMPTVIIHLLLAPVLANIKPGLDVRHDT